MFARLIVLFLSLTVPAVIPQADEIPWTEGEASVFIDNEKTPDYARKLSLNQALANAVEKVSGLSINQVRTVENSALGVDITQAMTNGVVLAHEVISRRGEALMFDDEPVFRYHTKVRARVGQRRVQHDPNFRVDLSLDKASLFTDEELTFKVHAYSDAYIHVFSIDSEGVVTVLLPNRFRRNNFLQANQALEFPSAEDRRNNIVLRAVLPANVIEVQEKIMVIATRQNVDLVGADFKEAVQVYGAADTGLYERLMTKLWDLRDTDWAQGLAAYRILKR